MKLLTFFSGLFAALPFVLFIEPLYSGYISLLFLIMVSDLKKINFIRLSFYVLYLSAIIISLINLDYDFSIKDLLLSMILPSIFLLIDLKFDYDSFFKGIGSGVIILAVSLIHLAYQKNLLSNFIIFFTKEREWGSDNLFYGNGTALVLTIIACFYLIKDNVLKAILINTIAVLTTSRVPLLMYVFIAIYLMLFSSVKRSYKYLMIFGSSLLIFYISTLILNDESLLYRFTKSGDREFIFEYSYNLFRKNIFFGFGPKDIPIYKHLHNSFFEILFRYGLFTFIFYLLIILKGNVFNFKSRFFIFIAFFYTFTQINLHNVNYLIIFSITVSFIKNKLNTNESLNKRIITHYGRRP